MPTPIGVLDSTFYHPLHQSRSLTAALGSWLRRFRSRSCNTTPFLTLLLLYGPYRTNSSQISHTTSRPQFILFCSFFIYRWVESAPFQVIMSSGSSPLSLNHASFLDQAYAALSSIGSYLRLPAVASTVCST